MSDKSLVDQLQDLVYPYEASMLAQAIVVTCLLVLIMVVCACAFYVRYRRDTLWLYSYDAAKGSIRPNGLIITYLLYCLFATLWIPSIALTIIQNTEQRFGPLVDIFIVVAFIPLHYIQLVTVWGNWHSLPATTNDSLTHNGDRKSWPMRFFVVFTGIWTILLVVAGILLEVQHFRTDAQYSNLRDILLQGVRGLPLIAPAQAKLIQIGELAVFHFRMCLFIYLAWEAVLLPTFFYTTWKTYSSITASLETLKDTASAAEYRSQAQTKTREVMDAYIPQSRVRADRLIRTRKIWIVNMASIALISICVTAEQAYLCYRAGLANASAGGDNYRVFAWFSWPLVIFGLFGSTIFLLDSFKNRSIRVRSSRSRSSRTDPEESGASIVLSPHVGRSDQVVNWREEDDWSQSDVKTPTRF